MCLGNTTSPAATNTTNVRNVWGRPDEWERPEVITPLAAPEVSDTGTATQNKSSLKAKPKAQSSKTSGGTY
ncbi:hypothetical protein CYIG_00014 [Cyanophage NATL1A-7]|uniref:Predicted protein n=1 Tax=Cyanophage NATL1A-7 TaxID=445693 RepID=E3SN86_9CAUD|nr:hypothetical protein CYIG_00014 [Cyanophage NATL1A-7]ADP00090.1 predicted protein [Cyanophage NATL1A-7]